MKLPIVFWAVLLLLLLCVPLSFANVDIVAKGDTLFVTYVLGSDSAFVYRHELEAPVYSGEFWHTSLGLAELPSSQFVLLWAGSADESPFIMDSLVLYDPANMNVLIERALSPDELHPWTGEIRLCGLRLSRYSLGDTECCVAAAIRTDWMDPVDVTNYRWLTTFDVEVAPWGILGVSDTMRYEVPYSDDVFQRPVHYQQAPPLIIAEHYFSPPFFYHSTSVTAGEHSWVGQPGSMNYETLFYEELHDPYGPDDPRARALALGSTGNCAIGLWSDTTWTVYCSIFDNGPAPAWTFEFDRSFDQLYPACAMSCNPEDTGALLVWFENGCIMGRHWEDEWNAWDRILAEDQLPVERENISVCSVIDSYWVAWLSEGADQPTVILVDREMVTGIGSPGSPELEQSLLLRVSPNPFSEAITIMAVGDHLPDRVEVYELSGRLVKSLDSGQAADTFVWNGTDENGREAPSGTYLIHGSSDGVVSSVRIVRL